LTSSELSLIATQPALESAVARLATGGLVAVDTEFVREKTYYPQLCLVQFAAEDAVAAVDCLAPLDLEPLYAELFHPTVTWLIHSARQDLEVVWQRTARMPPRLIDTQIAAGLLGYPPQIGLEDLLARVVGVELGESFARTDWSRRPLPAPALRYALDDVRFLLDAWGQLAARLDALGRRTWLEEDCARLLAEPPTAEPAAVFTRLKAASGLSSASQRAAFALVRWRERAAQAADRPRRWLLADEVLVAIAAALPATPDDLAELLPPRFAARHGAQILGALADRDDDEAHIVVEAANATRALDRKQLKEMQETVRTRAATLGIEPEILATRRDLASIAAGSPPRHLQSGWRAAELAFGV
jgi:ribonuclease D